MNKREEERLNALLAKKEAEEKAEKEFFKQVRKRKDEVLKHLKVDEAPKIPIEELKEAPNIYEMRLGEIAEKYGCDKFALLDYIETPRQIEYYRKYYGNKETL